MPSFIPTLAGVHHLKLPVADLARTVEWYASRLGYAVTVEFREGDRLTGVGMAHSDGGPPLSFVAMPEKAAAAAGFDYFSIGVPDRDAITALADHLSALGEEHAGVHLASFGWILPLLHDPDGHEVRFYTVESHTDIPKGDPTVIKDARRTAEAKEAALGAGAGGP